MFRLAVVIFGAAVISMLFFNLGVVIYHHPWDSFVMIAGIVGVLLSIGTAITFGFFITEFLQKRKYKNEKVPDSLFVAKYKAYKSKVCPMVEYDK